MKYYLLITFAILFSGSLYTSKQAEDMAINLAKNSIYMEPVQLGDLLYVNIHQHISDDQMAGHNTPTDYKFGWRKKVLNNPSLVFSAIKTFGPKFKLDFEQQLQKNIADSHPKRCPCVDEEEAIQRWKDFGWSSTYPKGWNADSVRINQRNCIQGWKADSVKVENEIKEFSLSKFWKQQREMNDKYTKLADALLSLPDSTLGKYLKEVRWEQAYCDCSNERLAVNLHTFLLSNGLIGKMPKDNYNYPGLRDENQVWHMSYYPLDLLLLAARVEKPRELLKNTKKAITTMNELL